MNPYALALRRFWWIALIGINAALVTAILMVYRVESLYPPKLEVRQPPSYVASYELLVNTSSAPFIQTETSRRFGGQSITTKGGSRGPSEVGPLIDAANLFPILLQSEQVAAVRDRMFGPIRGVVEANALFATRTAAKFHPSPLPIIVLSATSPTPSEAIKLAGGTVRAFRRWLVRNQTSAGVPVSQRITVQDLQIPRAAGEISHSSRSLALFVAAAVLAAFGALAVLLDKLRPRRSSTSLLASPVPSRAPEGASTDPKEAPTKLTEESSVTISDLAALLNTLVANEHRAGGHVSVDGARERSPAGSDRIEGGVTALRPIVEPEAAHHEEEAETGRQARAERQLGSD